MKIYLAAVSYGRAYLVEVGVEEKPKTFVPIPGAVKYIIGRTYIKNRYGKTDRIVFRSLRIAVVSLLDGIEQNIEAYIEKIDRLETDAAKLRDALQMAAEAKDQVE